MKRFFLLATSLSCFLATLVLLFTSTQMQFVQVHQPQKTGRSGALEALEFWTASRAYPDADISSNKFYSGFEQSKKWMKEIPNTPFSDYDWQFIGPVNLAGRTIALALNPINGNTLWAGSASGGLWRSPTGGVGGNWERVKIGYPVLGVNAVAIDKNDTNTIYIGTGEVYRYVAASGGTVIRTTRGSYGMGILKTTDNGETWTKVLDWSYNQQQGVQVIKINPLNSNTVWAGTTAGVYKSTDAGLTWTNTVALPAMDLVVHLTDSNKVIASCGNFGYAATVIRTSDGGMNWENLIFPDYLGKTMLGISESNPDIVYASVGDDSTNGTGSLWKTTDFGLSWNEQSNSSTHGIWGVQGWYSHYVAVHPTTPDLLVHAVVGMGRSTNGGVNFSGASSYSDHHAFALHPTNPNILYDANDNGIYRSTNFGQSFVHVSSGYNTGQFYNGFSNSTTDSLLSIGQVQDHIPGYMYSGSTNWTRSAMDEVGWTGINPSNDNIMYAAWRGGSNIYRSTNRGVSFSNVQSFGTTGAWNAPFVIAPSNSSVVYFGKQKVYKTTDGGTSWTATNSNTNIDGNPTLSMGISKTNDNVVYIGTAPYTTRAQVWKTVNGGTSWQNITGTLPDRYPNDITVDPNNSNSAYIAFGGFGTGHFYKTTDGGTSWTNITGILPDVPGTAVMVDPLNSNNVFAGNDIGVFISTDAGTTWNNFSDGLPDAVLVSDITYSPSNRILRVATHGNGVFERKLPSAFPSVFLNFPNGNELWEATSTQLIEWSPLVVSNVNLEYSTDNGSSWITIADNVPSTPSNYTWNVPTTLTTSALIKISSAENPAVFDLSDASFTIYFAGAIVSPSAGWNLVSLPLTFEDRRKTTLFPTAVSSAIEFNGSYNQKDTLLNGIGYWLKFSESQAVIMRGDSVHSDTIEIQEGWNIIGGISSPVSVSSIIEEPSNLLSTDFFAYNYGYENALTIEPGKGYWVKANSSGIIILNDALTFQHSSHKQDYQTTCNRLTIRDARGNKQILYFGNANQQVNNQSAELPPLPPAGIFDVRFTSQQSLALADENGHSKFPIHLSSVHYPITISWEIIEKNSINWMLHSNGNIFVLDGTGSTILSEEETSNLQLQAEVNAIAIPAQTRLLQNFPNPFNPQTTIRFELGEKSFVTVKIFDALGRQVANLIENELESGYHEVTWNATEYPSGIYIVQLQNSNLSFQTRILLLK
ncbi:MAG: T9SS type A sorting domain-containing protein [Ignavibacteriae bacterium]|nr:T9SS type A sorting domain-containing protein [Ignavibacteriota bacterium]